MALARQAPRLSLELRTQALDIAEKWQDTGGDSVTCVKTTDTVVKDGATPLFHENFCGLGGKKKNLTYI